MSKPSAQFIDPRQAGLRGLDLKQPVFSPEAIARADQALQSIGGSMQEWLDADVDRLQQARAAAEAQAWRHDALEKIGGVAHELKGMGATYGFPLVTQIAASLCRLIETDSGKAIAQADPTLVCAHIDALRAAVRDQVKTDSHPVGRALLTALETHVAKLGVAPR